MYMHNNHCQQVTAHLQFIIIIIIIQEAVNNGVAPWWSLPSWQVTGRTLHFPVPFPWPSWWWWSATKTCSSGLTPCTCICMCKLLVLLKKNELLNPFMFQYAVKQKTIVTTSFCYMKRVTLYTIFCQQYLDIVNCCSWRAVKLLISNT